MSTVVSNLIDSIHDFICTKVNRNEDLSRSDISMLNSCFDTILLEIKSSN